MRKQNLQVVEYYNSFYLIKKKAGNSKKFTKKVKKN